MTDSIAHLSAHHGDFKNFAQKMIDTHHGRFNDVFWSFLEQHTDISEAKAAHIVDLGTGPGGFLRDVTKRYETTSATGVEVQPEMIKLARDLVNEDSSRRTLVEACVSEPPLPLEDECADVVLASVLLHEIPVPTLLLDETLRILKPGGHFILLDWVCQPLSSYAKGVRPETLDAFTHFSEHCRYTAQDLEWLLEQSGFVVEDWMLRNKGRFLLLSAQKPL
ncbi:MAG: class I SAM-dependent methyltransferase [Deltaproteobacteria bacterium]|nr:class I SAM-dependent methyltransferase [Deltaproteobacteria bacterium]